MPMPRGVFFRQLFLLTLIVGLLLLALQRVPVLAAHASFFWMSLAFFVIICIVAYLVGNRAVLRKNKFAFVNAALWLTFVKMVLCVALIAVYIKIANPPTRFFILPFLGLYVIFTIFETYFLMNIGKTK